MGQAAATRTRIRHDLHRIVHGGLDLPDLAQTISRSLNHAVPFDGTCLLTVDPATLLPTREVIENGLTPAAIGRLTDIEFGEDDINKFTTLARAAIPAASLSDATSGELDRSTRHRELRRPSGYADELRAVLTDATGTWGTLTLLRETKRPNFTPTDVRFVASLTPTLADGLRRATLIDEAHDDHTDTGVLVLAADNTIELVNPAAQTWIDELAPHRTPTTLQPTAIGAVAAQARRIAAGDQTLRATARVHTRAGHWLMIRGSPTGSDRVTILLEAARPAELASAIADSYAFTERERAITALVARGLTTAEIADRLHLAKYTVQDHLKAIFAKSDTSTRGELVSRLFLDHHLPTLAHSPDQHSP